MIVRHSSYFTSLHQGRNIPYKFKYSENADIYYVEVPKEVIHYIFFNLLLTAKTKSNKLVIHDNCLRHTEIDFDLDYPNPND